MEENSRIDRSFRSFQFHLAYISIWSKTVKIAISLSTRLPADTLALDISALGLEGVAGSWSAQLRESERIELEQMELIPAAKSESWLVHDTKGWIPRAHLDELENKKRLEKPPIRPLAHLTVRDQTWATAEVATATPAKPPL